MTVESREGDPQRVVMEQRDAGEREAKSTKSIGICGTKAPRGPPAAVKCAIIRLQDPTMTERRLAAQERAALVGLVTGAMRRADAEQSLDELAGLADAAGAAVVLRALQERPTPDPATFLGRGKAQDAGAWRAPRARVDVVIVDNELTPAQLRELEDVGRPQGRRSHAAHPRHLRQARAHARRQAAGGAGAARSTCCRGSSAPARRCRGSAAASARADPARRSSRPTAARIRTRIKVDRATTSSRSASAAASCASGATRRWCRRWRSSATPTPARRRCSTG